jgi:uncharacterized protein
MKAFSWSYFATYAAGMIVLYWSVFILAAWIRGFTEKNRAARWFTKKMGFAGYLLGATVGAITPFCSCSTVPVFLGMVESRVRLGYCMSFLISSPLIDPPALILFLALFGAKLTVAYVVLCFAISIIGGLVLGRERFVPLVGSMFTATADDSIRFNFKNANIGYLHFLPKLGPVVLIAATAATFLKGWVPPEGLFEHIGRHLGLAIPAASVIGGMIYSELGLLLPVGKLFVSKGLNAGIVFSFMMASAGISIPSVLLLSRVMKPKLLVFYAGISLCLFALSGYTISALRALQWL